MLKQILPVLALTLSGLPLPGLHAVAQEAPAMESNWRPVDPENLIFLDLGQNGVIFIELFPEAAPENTAAVREAVRSGYYDGEYFYRVVENHVAQAGKEFDQILKDRPALPLEAEREADPGGFDGFGNGDLFAPAVGHRQGFPAGRQHGQEWLLNCPGMVGIARDDVPDTGRTEIYIPLQPRRYLDRNYTIVGRVIDGMDVVSRLQRVEPFNEEETAALFGEDAPLAYQMSQYRASMLNPNMIIAAHVAADLPADTRPAFEVMKTPSPEWEALKESKRDYSGVSAFVHTPPDVVDICTLPVPARYVEPDAGTAP
ncbi:MAG: peptidylprolyl isomerase [Rhodobacterales bacterium]|nr:peptidylprolyl isomerase [Rhodobacterales bacterium]